MKSLSSDKIYGNWANLPLATDKLNLVFCNPLHTKIQLKPEDLAFLKKQATLLTGVIMVSDHNSNPKWYKSIPEELTKQFSNRAKLIIPKLFKTKSEATTKL